MDKKENDKVNLQKNDNEINNENINDTSSYDAFGQQGQSDNENVSPYDEGNNQNNAYSEEQYQNNGYQNNSYNADRTNANQNGFNNNVNPGGNTWNNSGYQDMNGQGASRSTFNPSGFSIAGLVFGILSLVCCCFWYVSGIFAVLGLIFSIIVLAKHKPGRGLAIAGVICSAIGLVIAVIMGIMVIYIGMNMSADDYKKIIDQINSME